MVTFFITRLKSHGQGEGDFLHIDFLFGYP